MSPRKFRRTSPKVISIIIIALLSLALAAAPNSADIEMRATARARGTDRPTAIRVGRAILAQGLAAQVTRIRCEKIGSHRICGLVLSGVKFKHPLDRRAFAAEAGAAIRAAFATAPLEEVDLWATVPLDAGKGVVVSGDAAAPTSATVFAISVPRVALPRLGDQLATGRDVFLGCGIRAIAGEGESAMIQTSTLPSGVRILTETMPQVRSATIGIWADVGSAAEPAEQRGISHLVEHMLFKGTPRRTAQRIAQEMDGIGGNLNAFTDKESTCYYAHVMDRHLPIAIDVLGDMFLHSLFDPGELRKEQQVVLEEIRMYDDSPDEMIHDLFTRTMWGGSDLGEPTIGYAHTVSSFESDDLRTWMQQRYAPPTVLVTAAGNLVHADVVELVAAAFAGFSGQAGTPAADRPRLTPDVSIAFKETEQAYVMLGSLGLSLRDDDRYALSVLDTILGGGMSSRLFQEVREKRGLAYSVYSFQQGYREAGLFGIYAGTSPERVQECVDVICGELDGVLAGVGDDEVALAREHLKGNLTLALESTSSRMMRLGRNELVYGRQVAVEELETQIDAVDAAAVDRVAQIVLAPETRGLCVLGPLSEDSIRFASRHTV